ncbi:GHKL domain-containing protein [Enterococcus sp. BWB1-3]|uniref:GHKL domain-containing protein n=1 Tax=Enterococcus sp. BWB1-3 TaxID=2787713 RepID=UPI0019234281|nr:GHKL domain-containing protein [Enterococcus sp. BWB1-3]MBL1230513.1 GHKL domain-containing protein [Enterococcus sp. BWB1-3]
MKLFLGTLFIIIFLLSSFVTSLNKTAFRLFQLLLLLYGLILLSMMPGSLLDKCLSFVLIILSLLLYQLFWLNNTNVQSISMLHSGLLLFLLFSVSVSQSIEVLSFIPSLMVYGFVCFISCQIGLFLFKNNFRYSGLLDGLKKRNIDIKKAALKVQLLYLSLFLFSLLFVSFYLYLTLTQLGIERTGILVLAYFLFVLLSFLHDLAVNSLKKQQQQEFHDIELQGLKQYTMELEKSLFNLQGFRHDYLNILTSLEQVINEENITGIKTVYQRVILPSKKQLTDNHAVFFKLNCLKPEFKSLLSSKITEIIHKNITLKLHVKTDMETAAILSLDLIRMLSILTDNAIEEAEKMDNSTIEISFLETENGHIISIGNSLHTQIEAVQELSNPYVSGKNGHSGLGLSIVDNLLEAYPNITLKTSVSDNKFVQTLFILSGEKC